MKYNDQDLSFINLLQKGGKRKIYHKNMDTVPKQLKQAYKSRIPISTDKYEDLMWMCTKLVIEEPHDFYNNLPHQ